MLVSKALTLSRLSNGIARNILSKNPKPNMQLVRNGHGGRFYYREEPKTKIPFYMELLIGVVWWNFLYHMFTDYHELLPHGFPNPASYTDEELGIPPDDE